MIQFNSPSEAFNSFVECGYLSSSCCRSSSSIRLEFVKSKFTINWIKRQSQSDLCRHIQFNVAVHQLNFLQQFGLWFRDNLNFGQWSLMSCIFLKMDLINSNWLSAEVNCKSSHCASKNPERLIGWPIWQKVCGQITRNSWWAVNFDCSSWEKRESRM